MAKTVINLGKYRLKQYDARNWAMEEHRAPAPSRGAAIAKDVSAKWRPCDRYFQSVRGALAYIIDHELIADGGEYDVRDVYEREVGILREVAEVADRLGEGADA